MTAGAPQTPHEALAALARREDLRLSDEALGRLATWSELVRTVGARTNLVGTLDEQRVHEELVIDSLQLLPLLAEAGAAADEPRHLVDVGSGAGVPGLLLAACLPGAATLIEPRMKRALFLRHAARQMGIGDRIAVHEARLEQCSDAQLHAGEARLFVSRAVFAPDEWRRRVAERAAPQDTIAVWRNAGPGSASATDRGADDDTDDPAVGTWTLVGQRRYEVPGIGPRVVTLLRCERPPER